MSNELVEKIKKDIFTAKWTDLQRHYALGALYLIDGDVDLLELSIAVANDDTSMIKKLLDEGKLGQIPSETAEKFLENNNLFQCSIVQPFVFAQLLES